MKSDCHLAPLPQTAKLHGYQFMASLGAVPRLRARWHMHDAAQVPAGRDLLAQPIELRSGRANDAPDKVVFKGQVHRARVLRPHPRLHIVEVEALTIPAANARLYPSRASWRVFPAGTAFSAVAAELLEDAGFPGAAPAPCPSTPLPAQFVCGGRPAWSLLLEACRVHGFALGAQSTLDPAAADKFFVVEKGSELASIGSAVTVRDDTTEGETRTALRDMSVTYAIEGPGTAAPWMEVATEQMWSAPAAEDLTLAAPAGVTEAVAKQWATGAKSRLTAAEQRVHLRLTEPRMSLGDALAMDSGLAPAACLQSDIIDADLVVTDVVAEARQMTDGEADVEVEVTLSPQAAPVPLGPTPPLARQPRLLTGVVLATPAEQSLIEVELDGPKVAASDRAKVLCEWTPHWFSGGKGGLNLPPLPGDRVVLLAEGEVYGRVLYLAAHPGNGRLGAVRGIIEGAPTAEFASDRSSELDSGHSMSADHLGRALVVGDSILQAWCGPAVGLPEDADALDSLVGVVVSADGCQGIGATMPGRLMTLATGPGGTVSVRSSERFGLEAAKGFSLRTAETLQLTAKEIDAKSDSKTTVDGGGKIELTATQIESSASAKHAISGMPVEVKGTPIKLN